MSSQEKESPDFEKILSFLKHISPREYQKQIYLTCSKKNTLVIVPTGLGKTLIALLLTIDRMLKFPDSKILFLAPTRPLAEQHFSYFKKHLPELFAQMDIFTGKTPAEKRKELWQNSDIVFSTPQCTGNDIKNNLYTLENVSLLIEDECHRCFKNYAYTYVAEKYLAHSRMPRILGLTASPGHEKEKIQQIAKNLGIEAYEIRTRDSPDVKEYMQKLEFDTIHVEFPEEFKKMTNSLKKISDRKIEELKSRKLLFGPPTKINVLNTQKKIMGAIASGNKHFNLLTGASACAQVLKVQHAIELIETQTLASAQEYIQGLFEQARKQESKAVQNVIKQPEFNLAYTQLMQLIARKAEHPKLLVLKDLVEREMQKNSKTKLLVFAQFRDTVVKICKEVNQIPGVNARVFVGQSKKTNQKKEETGLSQKEQQELIKEFSLGTVNLLASTSIGEEGLDIPEVNTVVFYEPVPSAIRKIQRAGRTARLSKGNLTVLITDGTRDESYYWTAFHKEKKMYKVISTLKDELENKSNLSNEEDKQRTLI